ncbi:hypothetical protein Nepgr_007393 [Nepenthes gracilis]|uniref:Translation initiation factor IF-2, chloroplastic n=1 Tax=Nepenthes gracilis TaxID=150966 RepID=A0AAD3S6R9_NEPGR|nr:hypothetical protein Nepgr_007393 [Nepenthes gracilis]
MSSLASLVSLGCSGASSSTNFEVSLSLVRSPSPLKGGSLPIRGCCCGFGRLGREKRFLYIPVCRYSVVTDHVSKQGNAVSLESTYRERKDEDADLILKPAPKAVLKSKSGAKPQLGVNSVPWHQSKVDADSETGKVEDVEERKKVIESLDEVLEKAEKLEGLRLRQLDRREGSYPENKPDAGASPSSGNVRPVNVSASQRSKITKSVWRKGNSIANGPKVVKEFPNIMKDKKVELRNGEDGKVQPETPVPVRPSPPLQGAEIKLQAKPSVATRPTLKKPVILKDVGAATKSSASDGNDLAAKGKQRKPILVDRFATKKPVIDPLIAEAVIVPSKPTKLPSGKFKDDYRKKIASSGGPRRRVADEIDDVEIADEETTQLNLPIPGAILARKGRKWSKASRKAARLQAAKEAAPVKVKILEVGEKGMLTEELAYNLAISEGEILGFLYSKGIKTDGVMTVDKAMVKMICKEYDVETVDATTVKVEEMARKTEILDEDDLDKLEARPPVLTIMGHVDHGKTSLLDYIRKSKVAASEAGGITQGIGAYKVLLPVDGKLQPCVFLDTPGHEAFGAMRARGARVTDIAIIVVAADDGARPQTIEAVAHAKAAGVPIVIAINKIDKDGARPEHVMQELSSIGLMPEDWGGDIPMVQISALKGDNIDDLLETVMLVAELQELKANPHRSAKGTAIEAGLHKSKGPIATFIVQNGTLRRGDIVVCGEAFGKVRALFDDGGNQVNEAGPSTPVQVIGLNTVPYAGEQFEVVSSLDVAREKAESHAETIRNDRIAAKAGDGKVTLSSLASAISVGKVSGLDLHQLNIVLKVDVQGSIEAIRQALQALPQDNVNLKFLLQAAGDVRTSDVDLAVASKAIILGFNVNAPSSVKSYADNRGIEIRIYGVIYELIDDVRNAMEGLLDPVEEQLTIGAAEVRAIFSSGSGRVAGCMVIEGKVVQGCGIRVMRNRKIVYTGFIDSLRRVKEAVKEVNAGLECGIGVEDYSDWEVGDILEAFNKVQKKRTLEEASASVAAALEEAGIAQ